MSGISCTLPEPLEIIPISIQKPILTADLTAGLTAEASKYGSGKLENRPYKRLEIWKFSHFQLFPTFILSDQKFMNPKMIFTTF